MNMAPIDPVDPTPEKPEVVIDDEIDFPQGTPTVTITKDGKVVPEKHLAFY